MAVVDESERDRPAQEWKVLQAEILRRIDEIDKRTLWQPVEPDWWCHMMDVARAVRGEGKE